MKYQKLNKNWNAEPLAPELTIAKTENCLELTFSLDSAAYQHIDAGDTGTHAFVDVYAYRLAAADEAAYKQGQYRFKNEELPWGPFYELVNSQWKKDFPSDKLIVNESAKKDKLRHFIFFFKENVFECLASEYSFTFTDTISDTLDEKYPKGYLNYFISMFASMFDKPTFNNYLIFIDLYLQMQNKKEFADLRNELKTIKSNNDLGLYLKFANYRQMDNFGVEQLNEMIRAVETYKLDK